MSRYSKIFQRLSASDKAIPVPVACITDCDIKPECVVTLLEDKFNSTWRLEGDDEESLNEFINKKKKNDCKNVKTFVSEKWTFEYCLAYYGLGSEVHKAICRAKSENLKVETKRVDDPLPNTGCAEETATNIYKPLILSNVSKAITAQYLAEILEEKIRTDNLTEEGFKSLLPPYIVAAIDHVTTKHGEDTDDK